MFFYRIPERAIISSLDFDPFSFFRGFMNELVNEKSALALMPHFEEHAIVEGEAELIHQAQEFMKASKARNTLKAYRGDWTCFLSWCKKMEKNALPASQQTVILYITYLASQQKKVSTLSRRISAINKFHKLAHCPLPTKTEEFKDFFAGVKNKLKTKQNKKKALITGDIQRIIDKMPLDKVIGVRDRALFLIGFAGGLRRSELVALDVGDVEWKEEGVILNINTSKTDQEGEGHRIGIHYGNHELTCPVLALKNWLLDGEIFDGPIFRGVDRHGNVSAKRLSDRNVAMIIKRCVVRAGLPPEQYAGHSLRAGLVTTAAMNDAPVSSIMKQTRHNSFDTVRGYIREGQIFKKNVSAMLGL